MEASSRVSIESVSIIISFNEQTRSVVSMLVFTFNNQKSRETFDDGVTIGKSEKRNTI